MVNTNWTNPKRLIAILFFLIGFGIVAYALFNALFGFLFDACSPAQRAAGTCFYAYESRGQQIIAVFLATTCCLLPSAIGSFTIGAFLWSGAKKDDLRDLEIDAYHKGKKD